MPWKKWQLGDPVTINRIIWDEKEEQAIRDVLEKDWFGPGYYVEKLEENLAEYVGVKHAQLLNSGSSALLLASQALQRTGRWNEGAMILHPACTFPTSCNPIWQSRMIPVFVDVEEGTYNIDANLVEQAIKKYPQIKGAIIPHLIGNIAEMDHIIELLDGRPLIEDSCDTIGGIYDNKPVGTWGNVAAFSFYGSHHITTAGVGGALLTNDSAVYETVHSMAFWGRQFITTGDLYYDFTQRYTYETIGYDMQMTEIQAAFGIAQLSRLDDMNYERKKQFELLDGLLRQWSEWLVLPKQHAKAKPSWFGYPVLIKENAPFDRSHFVRHLIEANIEIRPLFAGNLTKQKAYQHVPYVIASDLAQSDRNMERALFLPSWGGMTKEMTAYLFGVLEGFFRQW